ncbi:unnamed protein product [marine sediment metagenome]|uniref:Uncharacterized protein n=1 Tax=marine sediment metagenome TaxID=412755 RepID=X1CX56_9ZZZZ
METFKTFKKAEKAAKSFFYRRFGYSNGVGVESAGGTRVEFYSLDDPVMNDTFVCIIHDGRDYFCYNGGKVKIQNY